LLAAIAALEQQRALLGDAAVDAAQAGLRKLLDDLAPAAPAPALRQVSILFLDMVGSTTLGSRLDPEALHGVFDGLLEASTDAVVRHQGRVLQYTGDGMLAAFGADGTREDDAERAVRCGLDLLALGQQWADRVRQQHGYEGFGVRVGAHTGPVLLGAGVDRDGSIRGLAVHVAARMEQAAPPGSLRISADTHALVRGLFEVEAAPPTLLKGLQEPMPSWLVKRALPRAASALQRGVQGRTTPLVGRDAAQQRLNQAWCDHVSSAEARVVLVLGDAGLGKTRLLAEFIRCARESCPGLRLLRGRALPSSQSRPYALLASLLLDALGLSEDADPQALRLRLEQRLVPMLARLDVDAAEAQAHVLAHLAGFAIGDSPHLPALRDDAAQLRLRGHHAAWRWLQACAGAGGPLMVVLEDLHWADDASLRWLQEGSRSLASWPLFMVAAARPELLERHPQGLGQGAAQVQEVLAPLAEDDQGRLAAALLEPLHGTAPALQSLLVERAQGNPFFMEELVGMLIDQGAIEIDPHTAAWRLQPDRLRPDAVPSTLTGVLQARLDSLPLPEREALQEASVLGPVFWDSGLFALDPAAPAQLPQLVRRSLTRSLGQAALPGWQAYAFGHALLHQVTYGTVLAERRRELHARAARWLAAHLDQGALDQPELAADHHERAGQPVEAAHYWWRAARQAAHRFDQNAVLEATARGLAALPDGAASTRRLRWELLLARNGALVRVGRRQRALLEEMSALADGLDDRERALTWSQWADWHLGKADWPAVEEASLKAERLARRAGDDSARLHAMRRRAGALGHLHRLDEARALADAALAEAEQAGQEAIVLILLNELAVIAGAQHEPVLSLRLKQRAVEQAARQRNRYVQAVLLGNLGNSWRVFGRLDQARQDTGSALGMLRAVGDRRAQVALLWVLSTLDLWAGDGEHGLERAEQALQVAREVEDLGREVLALFGRAEALLALGRLDDARAAFLDCQAQAETLDDSTRFDAEAALAWIASRRGDPGQVRLRLARLEAWREAGSSFDDTETLQLLWRCHEAARGLDERTSSAWLERAQAYVELTSQRLADDPELLRSFHEGHPYVRRVRAAHAAQGGA
jgi:predicted ATPase/class 3 adenylate cyclase